MQSSRLGDQDRGLRARDKAEWKYLYTVQPGVFMVGNVRR